MGIVTAIASFFVFLVLWCNFAGHAGSFDTMQKLLIVLVLPACSTIMFMALVS